VLANGADRDGDSRRVITVIRLAALGWCLILLAACRHSVRGTVSSEGSDYSPTLRAAVRLALRDSVYVTLDSGVVVAPMAAGSAFRGQVTATRLSMTAHVVTQSSAAGPYASGGTRGWSRPWRVLQSSLPIAVADSLRLGVPILLPKRVIAMIRPTEVASPTWILFTLRGDLVSWERDPAGTRLRPRVYRDAILVYSCAAWDLSGRPNTSRTRMLAEHYSEAC
jgi:hypothetical protein